MSNIFIPSDLDSKGLGSMLGVEFLLLWRLPITGHLEYSLGFFTFLGYFFGGINYMHMDPKAQYNGEWISLQPLGTEGQETSFNSQKKYSLHQIVLPFGIGIKVNLSHHSCLSFEYGIRKTF